MGLNITHHLRVNVADAGLIVSTLIMVETTLYAVAVALYALLVQRASLTLVDRTLVATSTDARRVVRELLPKALDSAVGRVFILWISLSYLACLLGGFWSLATDEIFWAMPGAGAFGGAFMSFLYNIEFQLPRMVKKMLQEILEPRAK